MVKLLKLFYVHNCFKKLYYIILENMAPCRGLNCTHGCKPTGKGPVCFCPEGMQPHKNECIGNIFHG